MNPLRKAHLTKLDFGTWKKALCSKIGNNDVLTKVSRP